MATFIVSCIAGALSILLSLLAAVGFLASNSWFGAGDLNSFAGFSTVFAFLMVCAAVLIRIILRRRSTAVCYVLSALFGLAAGFAFTWMVALILGPWFRAFSFPVLYCWMLSEFGSMLFAVSVARHNEV